MNLLEMNTIFPIQSGTTQVLRGQENNFVNLSGLTLGRYEVYGYYKYAISEETLYTEDGLLLEVIESEPEMKIIKVMFLNNNQHTNDCYLDIFFFKNGVFSYYVSVPVTEDFDFAWGNF